MIEAILRSIAAQIGANVRQAKDRRVQATQALTDALRARIAPAVAVPSPGARPAAPRPPRSAAPPLPPVLVGGPNPSSEAVNVRRLIASPQSLGAAFIAAEILAKPVALRER